MKLISTIRYTSGGSASSGEYGGGLRLFFSTLNAADFAATPAPIQWKVTAATAAVDAYALPGGDKISLNLNVVAPLPGQLHVQGAIQGTTAGGKTFGGPIGQGPGILFAPGAAAVAILKGRTQGAANGVTYDVGFELAVPWDGTSADCSGSWWAVWH